MDEGLRGQSAYLYLLTDLRHLGWRLISKSHEIVRQHRLTLVTRGTQLIRPIRVTCLRCTEICLNFFEICITWLLQYFEGCNNLTYSGYMAYREVKYLTAPVEDKISHIELLKIKQMFILLMSTFFQGVVYNPAF